MDQALKARLIGAVILVGLAVLVIPELLSGRKNDQPAPSAVTTDGPVTPQASPASRTITIELGAQQSDPRAGSVADSPAQTPVPEPVEQVDRPSQQADATAATADTTVANDASTKTVAPPVADARPAARVAATTPAVKTADGTAPAKPVANSSPQAASGSGRTWSVQVGAFSTSTAAQKLATELDGAGFAAYVASARQGSKALHRVRVGPVPDRSEADRLASRLKSRGLPVTVVAND